MRKYNSLHHARRTRKKNQLCLVRGLSFFQTALRGAVCRSPSFVVGGGGGGPRRPLAAAVADEGSSCGEGEGREGKERG